jgi:hypothetical protein
MKLLVDTALAARGFADQSRPQANPIAMPREDANKFQIVQI